MEVKRIKYVLFTGFLLCCKVAYSRQPLQEDTTGKAYTEQLAKTYPQKNELFLEELKAATGDKKLLKYYESGYKALFKALNERIKEGQMIEVPVISVALNRILQEISAKNPQVPKDVEVLVIRENLPNAYTLGDNTIFVNLGLFYYLESEDQVAGTLCHEIGHLLMQHSLGALKADYERNQEHVAVVKTVRKTELKKTDCAFELLKKSIYKEEQIRREHEMQADSLGYELMKRTRYKGAALISALEIIERNDTIVHDDLAIETYKRMFDIPGQKFKEKWLEGEDFSSYNYGQFTHKWDKDSISSHPKGEERIGHLKHIFPELAKEGNVRSGEITDGFKALKAAAEWERMPNLYLGEQYGEGLYQSLVALEKNPADEYHKGWLGTNLRKIYEARRDYQLNKYLDRVSPESQSESYRRYLNFMWNLALDELKNISDYYPAK